jgi:hypothetical protein
MRICDFFKLICSKIVASPRYAENCRRRPMKSRFFLGGGSAQNYIGARRLGFGLLPQGPGYHCSPHPPTWILVFLVA